MPVAFAQSEGWVYLRTARTGMDTHPSTSLWERETGARARPKPASAPRRPSARRGGKPRRGNSLICFLTSIIAEILKSVSDQISSLACPGTFWGGRRGRFAAKQKSVPLPVSLLFQMTVDQLDQLQI